MSLVENRPKPYHQMSPYLTWWSFKSHVVTGHWRCQQSDKLLMTFLSRTSVFCAAIRLSGVCTNIFSAYIQLELCTVLFNNCVPLEEEKKCFSRFSAPAEVTTLAWKTGECWRNVCGLQGGFYGDTLNAASVVFCNLPRNCFWRRHCNCLAWMPSNFKEN